VKQAPFVVLIGAQMPSILRGDLVPDEPERGDALKQPAYRQRIAQALFDAIVKHQASLKKVTTVASKGGER
jgi:N-acetylmuramoyl-L-alanine amidase